MAISPIDPYPMPTQQDLPKSLVSWRPDPERAVLLVHDMQAYFLSPYTSGRSPLTDLVENVRRLQRAAADMHIPVVFTAQPGGMTPAERGIQHDFWGPGMAAEPRHRRILDEVAPRDSDVVLTKWRYSAFVRTGLQQFLNGQHRDQLIICGVYAHLGCLITACDAFMRDIQPFFVADAVADFSPDEHRMAIEYVARSCGVVLPTHEVIDALLSGRLGVSTWVG